MLEHFYKSSQHLQKLHQPPFAESINALAARFHQLSYPIRYGQRILWIVGKFNDYARQIGIESAAEISEKLVRHFIDDGLSHQRFLGPTAMNHLWKYLQDWEIVPKAAVQHSHVPYESILSEYDEYLCNIRGLARVSCATSLLSVRRFLAWLWNRHGG